MKNPENGHAHLLYALHTAVRTAVCKAYNR
ncbi:hypothetical protein [Escherichia coli]